MYSFTCWSVAGRPGTSDLLLEARVRSCTHTPRPKGRIKPARRFGRTTAGLRPPCLRPKRPTYVSLTGQGCCRARHRPATPEHVAKQGHAVLAWGPDPVCGRVGGASAR